MSRIDSHYYLRNLLSINKESQILRMAFDCFYRYSFLSNNRFESHCFLLLPIPKLVCAIVAVQTLTFPLRFSVNFAHYRDGD